MRLSQSFCPVIKEDPADAQIASHRYMVRAGYVHQTVSGIYSWLPLGQRVLQKIEQLIALEQDAIHAERIIMPTIQPATLWEESGRYEDYGKEMLRIKDRHDRSLLYGPTHEEVVTALARDYVFSYRQLPLTLYQIHWKFRDEIRPRFGVMRGREFLMKDAYSFDATYEDAVQSYEKMYNAYLRTFGRMGLKAIPVSANSGAIGGNLSHEFHILAPTGESTIYYDRCLDTMDPHHRTMERLKEVYTAADDKHDPATCSINVMDVQTSRSIEVGHIFYFGTKYSTSMNMHVTGPDGHGFFPHMGSYGIGVSRLVGAIIEANHDDHGIIWPEAVAPFFVSIINAKSGDERTTDIADLLYERLSNAGVEVMMDDRSERAGIKFATADLMGIPWQIIVGQKTIDLGMVELKYRRTNERLLMEWESLVHYMIEGVRQWHQHCFTKKTFDPTFRSTHDLIKDSEASSLLRILFP
jgi:prolyl-tRNA synthetase